MTFVAAFGNIPLFFCRFEPPLSSKSSSAVPSPEPTLLSKPSPEKQKQN
jgi:hypothetical protein